MTQSSRGSPVPDGRLAHLRGNFRRIDTKLKMHRRVKIGKNKSSKISHILNRDINYVIDLTLLSFSIQASPPFLKPTLRVIHGPGTRERIVLISNRREWIHLLRSF